MFDGGGVHVSARVLMGTKVIRAETARADASAKGMRTKLRRKDEPINLKNGTVLALRGLFRAYILDLSFFSR